MRENKTNNFLKKIKKFLEDIWNF